MFQGRVLGAYTLTELLGRGGMGEVWRARHRILERPVAIKLIRPESAGSNDGRGVAAGESTAPVRPLVTRFECEAQATAMLQSPHTVRVYDFGVTDDGTFYCVMELLEGPTLEQFVNRFGPIDVPRAAFILSQICDSLSEAHANGIVHRDVKPANVILTRLGSKFDFVKLVDFGLAKTKNADSCTHSDVALQGVVVGSPAFIAPESVTAPGDVDSRADVYSLGCVAYWLLTGQLVFTGATASELIESHLRDFPVRPSRRTELTIPPRLEDIIMACLEKDRDRRLQSVAALNEALESCQFGGAWSWQRAAEWFRLHAPDVRSAMSDPALRYV